MASAGYSHRALISVSQDTHLWPVLPRIPQENCFLQAHTFIVRFHWLFSLNDVCRCDEKTWRKLLSYLETTSTEGSGTAPTELTGRICPLKEQLEPKGHHEEKLETNVEEVTVWKSCLCIFRELHPYLFVFYPGQSALCCCCFSLCCSLSDQTPPAFLQQLHFYSGSHPKLPLEDEMYPQPFKHCPWFTEVPQLWIKHSP